jgi:uncharacterized protein (TIGR02453 family)
MFQGFSDAAVDFLWGVRFNNERGWFEQHKGEYTQYVYEPMKQLNAELYQRMSAAYPKQSFLSKVTRIYRDARRLHGRGPYKDHLWLTLQGPVEHWTDTPVFWFELSPESWDYGLGVYCSQALTAAKLRARMDADPKPMEKLTRKLNRQTEFVLEGPEYARAKAAPSPLLAEWYNKKNYSLIHQEPISDALYSSALTDRIFDGWKFLMPFYEYLSTVPGDPDPRP